MDEWLELLTVEQIVEATGSSKQHVYELIRRKEIPSVRLGRLVRVPRAAFRQWIQLHAARSIAA